MYMVMLCIVLLWLYFDGFVQDGSNSSALAMELLQSCTKPSIYGSVQEGSNSIANTLPDYLHDWNWIHEVLI